MRLSTYQTMHTPGASALSFSVIPDNNPNSGKKVCQKLIKQGETCLCQAKGDSPGARRSLKVGFSIPQCLNRIPKYYGTSTNRLRESKYGA
jgi:hypothetical protein